MFLLGKREKAEPKQGAEKKKEGRLHDVMLNLVLNCTGQGMLSDGIELRTIMYQFYRTVMG